MLKDILRRIEISREILWRDMPITRLKKLTLTLGQSRCHSYHISHGLELKDWSIGCFGIAGENGVFELCHIKRIQIQVKNQMLIE